MNKERTINFFIRHLPVNDARRSKGQIFQVQVVDRHGLATAFEYIGEDCSSLQMGEITVPPSVLKAVNSLKPGESRFVDSSGAELLPKDLPLEGK